MANIFLGVAADDFTGASDAASFLVAAGVPTVLFNGIPKIQPKLREDTAAVVVALKTRTMPADQAVHESMEAFGWLKALGAEKLYLKYCSTFDSTADGNIGPAADAVLEKYGIPYTVLCPSLPVNGRTVRDGKLYVDGILLEESHMKDHPLTPMRDSCIPRLMEAQSKYRTFLEVPAEAPEHFYVVPDYYEENHGNMIAEEYWDLPFFTGGSGLAGALGRRFSRQVRRSGEGEAAEGEGLAATEGIPAAGGEGAWKPALTARPDGRNDEPETEGRALLLAGSCSAITLRQIADYQKKGRPSLRIWPEELLKGTQTKDEIFQWILETGSGGLVYSSASPDELKESQRYGRERVAAMLEETISALAKAAVQAGYTRIITAGGETSGAVTKALGYEAFYIGASVAPGVPVMTPVENPGLRLVLKSGNFGQEDFFARALAVTGGYSRRADM